MRCGVLVNPILFFISHAVATGNLAYGTGLVAGAGQWSVAEGFRSVPPSVGVPFVDDHLHRHDTAPDAAITLGIVRRYRQAAMSSVAIDRQRWRDAVPRSRCSLLFSTSDQFQFADFVDISAFQPQIHHPMSQPLDLVT